MLLYTSSNVTSHSTVVPLKISCSLTERRVQSTNTNRPPRLFRDSLGPSGAADQRHPGKTCDKILHSSSSRLLSSISMTDS